MTIQEVVKDLRSQVKRYIDAGIRQSTYSRTLQRIEQGTAKPCTIKKFFNAFGYDGEFNDWDRMA